MDEKFHKEAQQVVDHNIHNYIDSAALWFVDIIKKKVADNDGSGLTFTCMAAGTMLAFSFEAYLNAIGTLIGVVFAWIAGFGPASYVLGLDALLG